MEDSIEKLKERYAGRTVSLEIRQADKKPLLVEKLNKCPWFEKLSQGDNGELLIQVKNADLAAMELPGILDSSAAGLKKLVAVEPTLEDIFMKAVNVG
jgi:hypothetical protein